MEYKIIDNKAWSTHLCTCDAESCFLSCVVPCHVYAKIKSYSTSKRLYFIHLFIYTLIYISIQQILYSQHYLNVHVCPSHLTDNCISITDNCETYYMVVDNILSSCTLKNNICIYDTNSCISHEDAHNSSSIFLIVTIIGYACIVCLHYSIREQIKLKQTISGNMIEDVIATTCCSTCGLAQEYREL